MNDASSTGTKVFIVASHTFPAGFWVSKFADDKDAVTTDNTTLNETAMGPNGDMVFWNVPNPLAVKLGVIPGSEDDKNLQILYNANRVAKNKASIKDIIQMVVHYANGTKDTYVNGVITEGPSGYTATSSARLNGNEYGFAFENKI